LLSDASIVAELQSGHLVIDPEPKATDYSTSSVDIHLGDIIRVFKEGHPAVEQTADLSHPAIHGSFDQLMENKTIPEGGLPLKPRQFVLGWTKERIGLPNDLCALIYGRSTLGRFGLVIHMTAPIIHPLFNAQVVLEICNFSPVTCLLKKDMPIGQLIFFRLDTPSQKAGLSTHWQGQKPTTTN
jgi:dCTP deaminase